MKHLFTILILLILISCKEDKKPIVVPQQNVTDTIKAEQPVKTYHPVIKDKSLYSREFVEFTKKYEYPSPIIVNGNKVEVDGEIVEFPSVIKMDKEYVFTAQGGNLLYELTVKRYTPADISFEFRLTDNGATTVYKGKARVGLGFWLGAESTNDDENGDVFLFDEYRGTTEDGLCEVIVGIGDPDEKNRIRAIFELHCDNETQNSKIKQDVTLREHIE